MSLCYSPGVRLAHERYIAEATSKSKGHIDAFKEYAVVSKYLVIMAVRPVTHNRKS